MTKHKRLYKAFMIALLMSFLYCADDDDYTKNALGVGWFSAPSRVCIHMVKATNNTSTGKYMVMAVNCISDSSFLFLYTLYAHYVSAAAAAPASLPVLLVCLVCVSKATIGMCEFVRQQFYYTSQKSAITPLS